MRTGSYIEFRGLFSTLFQFILLDSKINLLHSFIFKFFFEIYS